MTVLTGETGAGKTLIVEAISLLIGRASRRHHGATRAEEALVEGRFAGTEPEGETRPDPGDSRLGTRPGLRGWPHGRRGRPGGPGRTTGRPARTARPPVTPEPADPTPGAGRRRRHRHRGADPGGPSGPGSAPARQAALGGDARARAHELDLLRYQSRRARRGPACRPDRRRRPPGGRGATVPRLVAAPGRGFGGGQADRPTRGSSTSWGRWWRRSAAPAPWACCPVGC